MFSALWKNPDDLLVLASIEEAKYSVQPSNLWAEGQSSLRQALCINSIFLVEKKKKTQQETKVKEKETDLKVESELALPCNKTTGPLLQNLYITQLLPLPPGSSSFRVTWDANSWAWNSENSHQIKPNF